MNGRLRCESEMEIEYANKMYYIITRVVLSPTQIGLDIKVLTPLSVT